MVMALEAIENGTFAVEQGRRIWLSRRTARLTLDYTASKLKTSNKRLRRVEAGTADVKDLELNILAKETGQSYGYLALHHDNFDDNPVPGKFHFKRSQRISVSKEDLGDRLALACN